MKIIGLCGGSGSGKGTAAIFFARHGIPSLDTDAIYHEMTSAPSPCLDELTAYFGKEILLPTGGLDRRKLSSIVFGEGGEEKLRALNRITHRQILAECRRRMERLEAEGVPAVLLDAPLLYESGFAAECDEVIAVLADRDRRIRRIVLRDGIGEDAAARRIASQASDEFLRAHADHILENNAGEEDLSRKVSILADKILNKNKGDFIMSEKTEGQLMLEKLAYKKKNVFEEYPPEKTHEIFTYAEGYKQFLDSAKTEREATECAIAMARANGYTEYELGDPVSVGDKKYYNNHGKSVILFRIGENDLEEDGIRIVASHIDSPRIDLKQVPMYEESNMAFLKTHYYGGIKKYQWTVIPLALHGVIVKADGETVKVSIGEDESDPIFYINDLLPHLAQRQSQEPLGSAIAGETLNILIGGLPYADKEVSDKIKLTALSLLYDKYGVTEEDLLSAELSLVPAYKARDIGFDRALIAGYGHDDRVCSYPALTALFANDDPKRTDMVILADKEEIGSVGQTGMQADIFLDLIDEVCAALGKDAILVRAKSKCLSADVTAAYDPNFADVYEKRNSAILSCGTCMCKFTGARGKSGSNDASAEYVAFVRSLFNEAGVIWQTSELGKVDAGGGGTVAAYIAKHNVETVDIGVPVISMHAPYEMISKADLYTTHEAFVAFLK